MCSTASCGKGVNAASSGVLLSEVTRVQEDIGRLLQEGRDVNINDEARSGEAWSSALAWQLVFRAG